MLPVDCPQCAVDAEHAVEQARHLLRSYGRGPRWYGLQLIDDPRALEMLLTRPPLSDVLLNDPKVRRIVARGHYAVFSQTHYVPSEEGAARFICEHPTVFVFVDRHHEVEGVVVDVANM